MNIGGFNLSPRQLVGKLTSKMFGGDTKQRIEAPKKSKGFSRWIAEIAPGRWKGVWRGQDDYKYCGGVGETRRRRLRILGLRGPRIPNDQLKDDFLTSLALARAAEYPNTHVNRKAA